MLTVKFLARTAAEQDPALWTALLPNADPESFGVRYTFDVDARDYDYLVVYEDLPYPDGSNRSERVERLACPQTNSLFVTTEPTSIKIYGRHYLRQFGHILSMQPKTVVEHPGHIRRTPPLRPYYGRPLGDDGHYQSYEDLASPLDVAKQADVSMVCSDKTMTPELKARYDFAMRMREEVGLHVFGRGIRPIHEKSEAMDGYQYHIAVENHLQPGHWTEKISDCFLAECLPLYHGDPELARAFPKESFIPIDITNIESSKATIREAIASDQYTARLPAIREAKRRVLEDLNLMKVCADIAHETYIGGPANGEIKGRHAFRKAHPVLAARDALWQRKWKGRW